LIATSAMIDRAPSALLKGTNPLYQWIRSACPARPTTLPPVPVLGQALCPV